MGDEEFEVGCEARDFGLPVADEGGGDDEEGRSCVVLLPSEQQCNHLQRLAEAHVIGEAGAEAEAGHELEPSVAFELIGAQGGAEIGWGW